MPYIVTPQRFLKWSTALIVISSVVGIALLCYGLYLALYNSPADYQQGESVRIMYIHVPSAWMALASYSFMAFCSITYLIWKNPMLDILARNTAPIGMSFTLITLITGSLWGKPVWGTWWEWQDARLTSVFILLFLYLGYIALSNAIQHAERAAKFCAVLCTIGAINLPIIKFSVEWFNTLHQPASVLRMNGPAIHESMLLPLLLMAIAFTCGWIALVTVRAKTALMEKKVAAHYKKFR